MIYNDTVDVCESRYKKLRQWISYIYQVIPGVGEYPNVLTNCWGPTLLDVDFEIGDHNLTVPSAEADSNCWWFPPR